MKNFFAILKNDYLHTIPELVSFIVMTVFALCSILLAVYLTESPRPAAHVAFSSEAAQAIPLSENLKQLSVTVVGEKPPRSQFMEQKYDAYVTVDAAGGIHVDTLYGTSFRNQLLQLLEDPETTVTMETMRNVGVNIIGFMMMFLLMLSSSFMFVFADDNETGILRRIIAAPVSFGEYLAAHCVYCFSLFFPEYCLLCILKLAGINIGFSLGAYAGFMLVLGFLGLSFSLLLHTLFRKADNANMLGNAVTVLASILAGGFSAKATSHAVLDTVTRFLPQKALMDFAGQLAGGFPVSWISMGYVVVVSCTLFGISWYILGKSYIKAD